MKPRDRSYLSATDPMSFGSKAPPDVVDQRITARVQELRYRVFNLELHEGLESSHATGRDVDVFDHHCHHLMVEHRPSNSVVGTYRLQTGAMARAGAGYYTDGEYDLSSLPADVLENL